MNTRNIFLFIFGVSFLLTLGPSMGRSQDASQQPSLADAARKARAEQKEQPKTAKVFTNDDIADLKGAVNVVGAAPTAAATEDAAAKASAPPATEKKDEEYFRGKFAAARRALADDSKELDVLQRELGLKEVQFYSDPNVALREQNDRGDINNTQAQIDAKKVDVAKDQQTISDLEDDLRKSGGDPGWETAPSSNTPQQNSAEPASTEPGAPQAAAPQADAPQPAAAQPTAPQESAPQ